MTKHLLGATMPLSMLQNISIDFVWYMLDVDTLDRDI